MNVKNKIKLKRVIIYAVVLIIVMNVIFTLFSYYQYRAYTINFNNKINQIVYNLSKNYPDIEKNKIIEILDSDEKNIKNTLEQYGIDLSKDSVILQNDNYFKIFLSLNAIFISSLFIVLLGLFLKYNYNKNKKLKEIIKYIEKINNGNYELDIEDNTEDELSILKNEIYKTTLTLREIAQNSLNDKLNIKNSLSDISHQLKTPLTSINIMLDNILENKDMNQEVRNKFIRNIKREILNITFLINSLLKLSRFDSNTIVYKKRNERLKNILNIVIKNVSMLIDLKDIKINVMGDENVKLSCDINWQVEALTNILKNCIEHSKNGSTIDIFYEKNKIYTLLKIKDNGTGIAKEDLPHIFERFYKGKNSTDGSIGIGFALSKSIIEKNNGYISVMSEIDKGTTFVIKYFA